MNNEEVVHNTLRSTAGEIEQFKESLVWKDILDELTTCIDLYKADMAALPSQAAEGRIPSGTLEIRMGRLDGTIKAFEWVADKMLDEMLLDITEGGVVPPSEQPPNNLGGPKPFTGTLM